VKRSSITRTRLPGRARLGTTASREITGASVLSSRTACMSKNAAGPAGCACAAAMPGSSSVDTFARFTVSATAAIHSTSLCAPNP
jgi:hypothetical protein